MPSPFPALVQQYMPEEIENKSVVKPQEEETKAQPKVESKPKIGQATNQDKGKKEAPQNQQPKAEKPKKEKQPKEPKSAATPTPAEAVDEVWDVYRNCDMRVGRIVEATPHPQSEKLYIEKIDVGEEGKLRLIGSGLQQHVALADMSGLCVVFVNLKPRKLADIMSEGMVMCASNADHTHVELMRPAEGSKVGERIQLEGDPILGKPVASTFEPTINPKKKYAERFLPLLKTNEAREGTYNGVRLVTSAGRITSQTIANGPIQ